MSKVVVLALGKTPGVQARRRASLWAAQRLVVDVPLVLGAAATATARQLDKPAHPHPLLVPAVGLVSPLGQLASHRSSFPVEEWMVVRAVM